MTPEINEMNLRELLKSYQEVHTKESRVEYLANRVTEESNKGKDETLLEPGVWFNKMKEQIQEYTEESVRGSLNYIVSELEKAEKLGQEALAANLRECARWVVAELEAYSEGYTRSVSLSMIIEVLSKVKLKPINSIKSVELSNYQRSIPEENMNDILQAKELGLFDEFYVLYTDMTGLENPDDAKVKEMVARNRDPVVLGVWKSFIPNTNNFHERAIVITDWEDEHCDLTFSKLISLTASEGYDIKPSETQLSLDDIKERIKTKVVEEDSDVKAPTLLNRLTSLFKSK